MNYKDAINQKTEYYSYNKAKNKLINSILTFVTIISAIVAIFVYGTVTSYYSAEVVGSSMYPTINSQKYNMPDIKNQIAYYTTHKTPQKGDIIIVDYEKAGLINVDAIKRLIAVGGDTICYYNGEILVNGKAIKQPYIDEGYKFLLENQSEYIANEWKTGGYEISKNNFNKFCEETLNGTRNNTTFSKNYATDYADSIQYNDAIQGYVLTVPQNFVYFLGDNRGNSNDSSHFGPLEKKYMLVKVDYIVDYGTNIFSAMWQNF